MRPLVACLLLSSLVLPTGCHRRVRRRVSYGSAGDVAAILRAGGVRGLALHCVNPTEGGAAIRAVACTTRVSAAQVATLEKRLPLSPGPGLHGAPAPKGACDARPAFAPKVAGMRVLVGKNTKVPNGAGRIEVRVKRTGGPACIEILYPWSG